jgi:hypothetical protein
MQVIARRPIADDMQRVSGMRPVGQSRLMDTKTYEEDNSAIGQP